MNLLSEQKELKIFPSHRSVLYLTYRWIFALFFLASLVFFFVNDHAKSTSFQAKWFIYVTNWTYLLCTFEVVLSVFMSKPRPSWYKLYWVSNVIATDGAIMITLIYWLCVYDPKKDTLDIVNLLQHVVLCVLMVLDYFVVALPVRFLQFWYPLAFFTSYGIFTLIYFAAGGESRNGDVFIYGVMDWRRPGVTLIKCGFIVIGTVAVHGVTWGLHRLRGAVERKRCQLTSFEEL